MASVKVAVRVRPFNRWVGRKGEGQQQPMHTHRAVGRIAFMAHDDVVVVARRSLGWRLGRRCLWRLAETPTPFMCGWGVCAERPGDGQSGRSDTAAAAAPTKRSSRAHCRAARRLLAGGCRQHLHAFSSQRAAVAALPPRGCPGTPCCHVPRPQRAGQTHPTCQLAPSSPPHLSPLRRPCSTPSPAASVPETPRTLL